MSKAARAAQEAAQDQDKEGTEQEQETTTETKTTTQTTEKTEGDEEAGGQEGAGDQAEGGFDVVEEGAEAQQAAQSIPLSTYRKKVEKFRGKIARAKGDAEARAAENELLKLENDQLKQRLASTEKKARPKRDDFTDDAAFQAAEDKWFDDQVESRVVKTLRKAAPAAAADDEPENDPKLRAHYERADKLKAGDFDQREDEVIGVLGQQAVRTIIHKFPNSEAVLYALGGNQKKLKEVAAAMKSDPVQAVIDLTDYARSLKLKPRTTAPDPDTREEGTTGGSSDAQKQYESMHAKWRAGSLPFTQLQNFKADCRKKGIPLKLLT